jgi:predicted N-acetyltransferase YhbS
MSERYLPELDAAQIAEACRQTHPLWGGGRSLKEHTARNLRRLAEAGPHLRYAGLVDARGELLASLKCYEILLACPGAGVVPALGIGAVFTALPRRRLGAATKLLEAALAEARARGDAAALLYSDIAPAFYARLGFLECPALDLAAEVSALPREGALATRPALREDEGRCLAWYEASYPRDFLRPARDEARWRLFRAKNAAGEELILSDGGRELGYLSVVPESEVLWIDEWAAPEVPAPRLFATLRALAEAAGARRLVGWMRRDTGAPWLSARRRDQAIPMVADLSGGLGLAEVPPEKMHFWSVDHF